MVTVRFFAGLREIMGCGELRVALAKGASVGDVFHGLQQEHPAIAPFRPVLMVALNQEYSDWEQIVMEGDEIAFFPPVSGGSCRPGGTGPTLSER